MRRYFLIFVGIFLVNPFGTFSVFGGDSIYEDLSNKTQCIARVWKQKRLPQEEATQKAKNILEVVNNPHNLGSRKATPHQFEITAKAVIGATLYDIRHTLVNGNGAFVLSPIQTNDPSLITHTSLVSALVFMTRVASEEINTRLGHSLASTSYPFDVQDFKKILCQKTLSLAQNLDPAYQENIKKALDTEWFVKNFLHWFDELDKEYDCQDETDFRKEVMAIQTRQKGSIQPLEDSNNKPYSLYKNEFDQPVALFKNQTMKESLSERICYELSRYIAPGEVAPNMYRYGQGFFKKYVSFVDRKEARYLLFKADSNATIPKIINEMAQNFVQYQQALESYYASENLDIAKDLLVTTPQSHGNILKKTSFQAGVTLETVFLALMNPCWDEDYLEEIYLPRNKELYKKSGQEPYTSEDYQPYLNHIKAVKPHLACMESLRKKFGTSLESAFPDLFEEIQKYYLANFTFSIAGAHHGNGMIISQQGKLRFTLIDTQRASLDSCVTQSPPKSFSFLIYLQTATGFMIRKPPITVPEMLFGKKIKEVIETRLNEFTDPQKRLYERYLEFFENKESIPQSYDQDYTSSPIYWLYHFYKNKKSPFY